MGYYKIKSHAGTGKLLNIAASGPISGRKNTNIWDESCPIDQTWSIASLGNNQFKVSNKSADILARIFCGHYERPGVPKISERVANAKKWYNFL